MGGKRRSARLLVYVQCALGLERLVADELLELGVPARPSGPGGVSLKGTARQLYLACGFSRIGTRVLVRAGQFQAHNFTTLIARAGELPWSTWLGEDTRPVFRVSSKASALYHEGAIAERLTDVAGGAGEREQLFVVRVYRDEFTISVDAAGEPLFKRGWRADSGKAPLRETLAAAMIRASGWGRDTALIDPFCGSGTIPIEAALLASGRAPALSREFAFQRWPSFEPGTWASVLAEAKSRQTEVAAPIVASDRDAGVVVATRRNAERAGVGGVVTAVERAISDLTPPDGPPGLLLTNPPYGGRLAGGDLRNLYARFGDIARERLSGWRIGLLAVDPRLTGQTGLTWTPRFATKNGGIDVTFVTTTVP